MISPARFIFDVNGTLVDNVDLRARAWQRVLAARGHEVDLPAVRKETGKGGDQLMPVLLSPAAAEAHGEEIETASRVALFDDPRHILRARDDQPIA